MDALMKFLPKLLAVALLPSVLLSLTARSFAQAVIPVDQVAAQLRSQTQIPIFLPMTFPAELPVYVNATAESDSYYVDFVATPDCDGQTFCLFGGMSAQRGGQLSSRADLGSGNILEPVQLANGVRGQFTEFCGATCTASMEWHSQGVLYTVSIKNGRRAEVIALANSAIAAGVQTPTATAIDPAEAVYGAVSTHWSQGADLEDRGDFNSAQIQYQRALAAAQQLDQPHLRDCAISGSLARIQAMEAARAYVRSYGTSPRAMQAAHRSAQQAFETTFATIDRERPDLANSCP
jgi:hypothetical protein